MAWIRSSPQFNLLWLLEIYLRARFITPRILCHFFVITGTKHGLLGGIVVVLVDRTIETTC